MGSVQWRIGRSNCGWRRRSLINTRIDPCGRVKNYLINQLANKFQQFVIPSIAGLVLCFVSFSAVTRWLQRFNCVFIESVGIERRVPFYWSWLKASRKRIDSSHVASFDWSSLEIHTCTGNDKDGRDTFILRVYFHSFRANLLLQYYQEGVKKRFAALLSVSVRGVPVSTRMKSTSTGHSHRVLDAQ